MTTIFRKRFSRAIEELPYDFFFGGGGGQWRATLDDILWNFSKLTMKFVWVEELRELKGNRGGSMQNEQLGQMSNLDKMNKLLSMKTEVTLSSYVACPFGLARKIIIFCSQQV